MKESDSFHHKRSQLFEGSLYYQPIHYVTMKRVMPFLYPWHFSINFDPPLPLKLTTLVFSQTPTNPRSSKKGSNCAAEKNPCPLETGLSSWPLLYESRPRSRHHCNLPTRRPAPRARRCCWRGSKWHQGRVESLNHQPRRRNLWRRSPEQKKWQPIFVHGNLCFWSKGMMMKSVVGPCILKGCGGYF